VKNQNAHVVIIFKKFEIDPEADEDDDESDDDA
jgi:hypothetical protein